MARPCQCDRCEKLGPYRAGDCALCWNWHNSPRYRAHWSRAPIPPRPRRHPVPCVHEGQVIERCPFGDEARHVRDCDIHDRCTRGLSRIRSCADCPDYETASAGDGDVSGLRHLLYHVLPVRGNGRWQRNLEQLRERITLFTGRKIVAVMTDAGKGYVHTPGTVRPDGARLPLLLDPPEAVESALAGCGCEFVRVGNDPNLREVASFDPLFGRLAETYRPGDVCLYAHAKGTTRRPGHPAKRWADVLYDAMLDYWPVVEGVLQSHPLAGCFLKRGRGWPAAMSRSEWHYSGSWCWFRCADLFARDWRRIDQMWSGIEPYWSQHFDAADAGVVFFQGRVPAVNLYSTRYWDTVVHGTWVKWTQQHSTRRTAIGSAAASSATA